MMKRKEKKYNIETTKFKATLAAKGYTSGYFDFDGFLINERRTDEENKTKTSPSNNRFK